MIFNGVSPRHTHDLTFLLQDLEQFINPLPDTAVDVLVLMKFYPTSRYPSDESEIEVTEEEFNHYLKIISECLSWAEDLTP